MAGSSHSQITNSKLFKTFHSFSKTIQGFFFSFLKFKTFQGWPWIQGRRRNPDTSHIYQPGLG